MKIGQVVFSKSGRDKGRAFVVLAVEDEYVFLADGQLRPLNRPKKKKAKHTQPTNNIVDSIIVGLGLSVATTSGGITDADIRKWLLPYNTKRLVDCSQLAKGNEEVSDCLRTM